MFVCDFNVNEFDGALFVVDVFLLSSIDRHRLEYIFIGCDTDIRRQERIVYRIW